MKMRIDLQYKLESILGSRNVYFQPPEYIRLHYPCIIYSLDNIKHEEANNIKYTKQKKYSVTVIFNDYDDVLHDRIINDLLDLDYCYFNRTFINENMYHYVFTLYF